MRKLLLPFLLLVFTFTRAQTATDTLTTRVNNVSKALNILREFRILAYSQVQYQLADTAGAKGFAGGDFPALSNNRFAVRRGRFKLTFDHDGKKGFRVFQAAFQMDITEKGVKLRDFNGRIIDPWTGWFGLQGGIMDRPFGYEVRTGDDTRETPERARLSQIVLPDEKDLGAELVIESPKTFKPCYVRLDAGIFNGTGGSFTPAGVAASSFTKKKDFIGSIKAAHTFKLDSAGKTNFTLSGGVSYYRGAVLQQTKGVYELKNDSTGVLAYTNIADTTMVNKAFYQRQYYGVDLQASLDYKIGTTTIRGEFISGQQPGGPSSMLVPTVLGSAAAPATDLYIRKFNGLYFYFIQTFKQKCKDHTILHELTFKYDWYDPNTQINGANMASIAKLNAADIKYNTFGVGYNFRPYDFFKLMVYYDIVKNASTPIGGFTGDLKDNVLTIRAQFLLDTDWFNKKAKNL